MRIRWIVACLVACCVAAPAFASWGRLIAPAPKNFLAPEERPLEGGRDVSLVIAQSEIRPSINAWDSKGSGGALGVLLDTAINNTHNKAGEARILPLRNALTGYDFETRVREATAATLAALPWIGVRQTNITHQDTEASMLATLDAAQTRQVLFLRYYYEMNPEFNALVVGVEASLVNKDAPPGKKPKTRLLLPNLPYGQKMRSVVYLPDAISEEDVGTLPAFAADNGKRARLALEQGIQHLQQLLTRSLTMTPAAGEAMLIKRGHRGGKKHGYAGWLVEENEAGMLIFEPYIGVLTHAAPVVD